MKLTFTHFGFKLVYKLSTNRKRIVRHHRQHCGSGQALVKRRRLACTAAKQKCYKSTKNELLLIMLYLHYLILCGMDEQECACSSSR
jgi:hypothetical protein